MSELTGFSINGTLFVRTSLIGSNNSIAIAC